MNCKLRNEIDWCKQKEMIRKLLTKITSNFYKGSLNILHQLVEVVIHVGNPEIGIWLINCFDTWSGYDFIELLFIVLFLYRLLLCLFNLLLILINHSFFWLFGWLLWLEDCLWTVTQELCINVQNILLLEQNVTCWVFLHLISCQTSPCLNFIFGNKSVHYFLELRSFI